MIYIKTIDNKHLLILEPDNLDRLKKEPLSTPNGDVTVAFTPDINWVSEQLIGIQSVRVITPDDIEDVLKRGSIRQEVRNKIYHPEIKLPLDGTEN